MRTFLAVAALSAVVAGPVLAQTGTAAAPVTDAGFVRQAAISDLFEIQASKLAQTKATSGDVKSFATKMIADHTKTSNQLRSIVGSNSGISLPTSLDATHRELLGRLNAASGASFDTLYSQQQLQAHQQAVLLFTGESQNARNSALKRFATTTLPALQQHLSMAQQLPKGGAAP